MDKKEALALLVSAVDMGVRKGVFCLEDTKNINAAIEILTAEINSN